LVFVEAKTTINWAKESSHDSSEKARSLLHQSLGMRQRLAAQPRRVVLNVGGVPFVTSLATVEGTVLSHYARTSGSDACIDRDPTHFRTILDYLRHRRRFQSHVAAAALPTAPALLAEVRAEAEFYGLHGLVRHVWGLHSACCT
jgi:hypothetical protein